MNKIDYRFYCEYDFKKSVGSDIVKYVFQKLNTYEIIKFLEHDYYETNSTDIDNDEKILLDLNNELINKYLVRYCKSKNTYYYLLELNETLINQGIHNLNIIVLYDEKLVNKLVLNDNLNNKLIKRFFYFYIENYKKTIFSRKNYLDSFIERKDNFVNLSDDKYIDILSCILTLRKIPKIIKKEKKESNEWMRNKTELQFSIWNLICNLNVNDNTIRLLSWIGEENYMNLDMHYHSNMSTEDMIDKWSNFMYGADVNNPERAGNNDKINVISLIRSYSKTSEIHSKKEKEYDDIEEEKKDVLDNIIEDLYDIHFIKSLGNFSIILGVLGILLLIYSFFSDKGLETQSYILIGVFILLMGLVVDLFKSQNILIIDTFIRLYLKFK